VPGAPQLIIYHAGSLSAAFAAAEQLFTQQTGVCVTDVAAGRCRPPPGGSRRAKSPAIFSPALISKLST
jgi:hypothetical protein